MLGRKSKDAAYFLGRYMHICFRMGKHERMDRIMDRIKYHLFCIASDTDC